MQNTKTYVYKRFCYSILAFFIIVYPVLAMADQHDTASEFQETPYRQVILAFLLLAILIFFVWMFFQYRKIAYELNNVKHKLEISIRVNNDIRQDLLNANKSIQKLTKDFDPEILYQKLGEKNENNTQQVIELLKLIIEILQNSDSLSLQNSQESFQQHGSGNGEGRLSQIVVEFCEYYNAGIKDRQVWANFMEEYDQNYTIDVVNAEERFLNPQADIDPVFETNSAGYYLVCYIVAEKLYAVVPVYDLVVEQSIYIPGAFGKVFKCSHFDEQRKYQITKLIQPAIFEPDDGKEIWSIKSEGILELKEV